MLKPTPLHPCMPRPIGKNSLLSSAIDRLYSQSPMARARSHNESHDTSMSSCYSANSSVTQKLKPSVQIQPAHTEERRSFMGKISSEMGDDNEDDDSVLLPMAETTHELLTALDVRPFVEPEVPRIPALCLTPRFLASKRNNRDLDHVDSDTLEEILEECNHSLLSKTTPTDDAETKANESEDMEENAEDPLVSQEIVQTKASREYSLIEWTVRPVDNHSCVLVEGMRTGYGQLWRSTGIERTLDKRTVQTGSGSVYKLLGPMDIESAKSYGFSATFCRAFRNGFPENWEEYVRKHFEKFKNDSQYDNNNDDYSDKNRNNNSNNNNRNNNNGSKRGGKSKSQKQKKGTNNDKPTRPRPVLTDVSPCTPLDLSTCERTRSGRIVVPSSAVAWWKGVRMYTTPKRPLEIRVETPLANQLDSPLAWPMNSDKTVFKTPTGRVVKRTSKSTKKTVLDKLETSKKEDEEEKKVVEEPKPRRRVTRAKKVEKSESVVEIPDTVVKPKSPVRNTLIRSPFTYPAHRTRQASKSKKSDKFRELFSDSTTDSSKHESAKSASSQDESDKETISDCAITSSKSSSGTTLYALNPSASSKEASDTDTMKTVGTSSNPSLYALNPIVVLSPVENSRTLRPRKRIEQSQKKSEKGQENREDGVEKNSVKNRRMKKNTAEVENSEAKPRTSRLRERKGKPARIDSDSSWEPERKKPSEKSKKVRSKVMEETTSRRKSLEISEDSDTDDEIFAARNRVKEKQFMNKSNNSSLNKSVGRKRASKSASFTVETVNEFGETETLTWTTDEVSRYNDALKNVPASSDNYWTKIAEIVESKTRDECLAFHLRDVPKSVQKQKAKKATLPKIVRNDDSVKIELSGGKGTFKRKRHLQALMDHVNEDFDNDYFDSTPWAKRQRRIALPTEDEEVPIPTSSMVNTPATHLALQPRSARKTPVSNFISPSMMDNSQNDELYIHRCVSKFRGKIGRAGRTGTQETESTEKGLSLQNDTKLIAELHQSVDEENEESEQDDYFSDDD